MLEATRALLPQNAPSRMFRLIFKLTIPLLAYVLAATIATVVWIWAGADLWIALIVVFGGLLLFGWYVDRKNKLRHAGR